MHRNLALYPWYAAGRSLLFWMPVFFLYFDSIVPVEQVLLLEAIYYVTVVALEVPSGYLSDILGRRPTLLVAGVATVAAHAAFVLAGTFAALLIGQALLAAAMAFQSGTDSALLYESLEATGREDEMARREARAQAAGFAAFGLAALAGGLLAGIDLRLAYVLSGAGGAAALGVALAFREPPRESRATGPRQQAAAVAACLRDPLLAWLLTFSVVLAVLVHVPYEFLQPYLGFLLDAAPDGGYAVAPAAAGAVLAVTMGVAAVASGAAVPLGARIGVHGVLLLSVAVAATIIVTMASVLHVLVVAVLLLRSVPIALVRPLASAAANRRLPGAVRATYLSVESLAGRLAFGLTLLVASRAVGDTAALEPAGMVRVLDGYALGALAVAPLLLLGARRIHRETRGA